MWQPLVDKFKKKLALWKRKCLSFAGRLTLIKSILSRLPIYFLSILKMLVGIAKLIDRVQYTILRGGDEVRRKVHLVKGRRCAKINAMVGLV